VGAPVTHWDGYDTHYTERYMSTPEKNPKGYAESSVMRRLADAPQRARGNPDEPPILLIHGMLDENVHFRHAARFLQALATKNFPYRLLVLPHERHSPRSEPEREYLEERLAQFLLKRLKPDALP